MGPSADAVMFLKLLFRTELLRAVRQITIAVAAKEAGDGEGSGPASRPKRGDQGHSQPLGWLHAGTTSEANRVAEKDTTCGISPT